MDYLLLFYFYHWREHVFKRKCIVELFKALTARDLSRPKTSRSSRTNFWPVTNHSLWSVSLAKNWRKYVFITSPSRLKNEEGGLERSSSYTRVACEESTKENHITFIFIKSDVTWPLSANGLFLWCDHSNETSSVSNTFTWWYYLFRI